MRVFSDSDGRICAVLAIRMRRHGRSMLTVPRIVCLLFWVEEAPAPPHFCCTYPARKERNHPVLALSRLHSCVRMHMYVDRRETHTFIYITHLSVSRGCWVYVCRVLNVFSRVFS